MAFDESEEDDEDDSMSPEVSANDDTSEKSVGKRFCEFVDSYSGNVCIILVFASVITNYIRVIAKHIQG